MPCGAFILALALAATMAGGQDVVRPPISAAGADAAKVADLIKQLGDADPDKRMEAAASLGTAGPAATVAIPNLIAALEDAVPAVRMKVIDALMFMGPAAAAAAPRIPAFLKDPNELIRASAVVALPRVTPDRASTVPLLKKALADDAWRVRRQAAIELIDQGAEISLAVPVLREGLKDTIPSDRMQAIVTLGKVAPPAERKELAALAAPGLAAPEIAVRRGTIRTLAALGAEGVPYLVPLLETDAEAPTIQMAVIQALARVGPEAKAAIPALERVAQRSGLWSKATQRAIAAIRGTPPPPARPSPSPGASPNP